LSQSSTQLRSLTPKKTYHIARRVIDGGVTHPARIVSTADGVMAEISEKSDNRDGPYGCLERIQELKVRFPERKQPGHYASEVKLEWDDGLTYNQKVSWQSEPELTITPQAIVLKKEELIARLLVRRNNKNVSVSGVEGNTVRGYSLKEEAKSGVVKIEIQLSQATSHEQSYIVIKTSNGLVSDYRVPILYLPE
jgi:hypothetical protein